MATASEATNTEEPKEGWGFPGQSRKCHYFEASRSLCGKWALFRERLEPDTGTKSPDDCAECRRRLDKKLAAKQATG
jgi:hypothetical protein